MITFMAQAGFTQTEIRKAFESALGLAGTTPSKTRRKSSRKEPAAGDVSALLLRLWHRDSKYLDNREYKPRPLPLLRGKNSLRSIVQQLDSTVEAEPLLRSMKATGLIRRTTDGRYLPTSSAVVLPALHPWAVEHTAQSVLRLLSTVARNSNGGEASPLLERYSYVPDLAPEFAQPFAEFARRQGQTLLDTLDDWLEQRCVKQFRNLNSTESSVGIPAGMHVITFLGEGNAAPVQRRRRAVGRRSNRSS